MWGVPAHAQEQSVVAVDESPTAQLLIQRVLDQSEDNVGEAARLCAELIEKYGSRLVSMNESDPDLFGTVRERVEEILLERPMLRQRFADLQSAAAVRALEAGEDDRVVALAWLTQAGLEASLVQAQADLEAGHIVAARQRLERLSRHPELQGREGAYRDFMLGIATHLIGDSSAADEASLALSERPDSDQLVKRLESLRSTLAPFSEQAVSALDTHYPPEPTAIGWHPVWSEPLETSLFAQSQSDRIQDSAALARLRESEEQRASSLTGVPLVTDDLVYVHDGSVVRAFDRFGADAGWTADIGNRRDDSRRSGLIVDLGELAIDGSALVFMNGVAYSTGRTYAGSVIRLDAQTGKEIWRTDIDGLRFFEDPDESAGEVEREFNLDGAFPYGNIIIANGNAIFPARKVNSRREMVLYLIALDLESGEPNWIRMMGSSGGVRTTRGFSRLIEHEGSIVVSSPVGVIGRVDPSTGEPNWVRRFPVPLSNVSVGGLPWEISQAAVLGNDLYALTPDSNEVVRLNFETGAILQRWNVGPGTIWSSPAYLIADESAPMGPTLYAVGQDLIALSGDEPGSVRWQLSESARDELSSRLGVSSRQGIRGRVHVAGDRILVPGIEDILLVDASSGRVMESIPSVGASNPVLLDSQLVLVGLEQVDSLMQLGPAEDLLRARMLDAPNDPSRALGLLELGIQARRPEISLEAAKHAANLLTEESVGGRTRDALVTMLLRLQSLVVEDSLDSAGEAIALAESIARTPAQKTTVRIALGDWYAASSMPERAIETWLSLLVDKVLSNELIELEDRMLRAHLLVLERVQQDETGVLAQKWGESAERALAAVAPGDIVGLEEVGSVYGDAPAAIEARRQMAAIQREEQQAQSVVQTMLSAIRAFPVDEQLRLDAVAALHQVGSMRDAEELLTSSVQSQVFSLPDATSIAETYGLQLKPLVDRPKAGLDFGVALEYPGRLLGVRNVSELGETYGASTSVLTMVDRTVQCRLSPDSLEFDWEADLPGRSPQILRRNEESVLLWCVPQLGAPVGIVLSMEDGSELWRTPAIDDVMPSSAASLPGSRPGRAGLMPGGGVFHASAVVPALCSQNVLLTRRNGDMAAVDLKWPSVDNTARWVRQGVLDRVYEVAANDQFIAVGGSRQRKDEFGNPLEVPNVVVLDAESGDVSVQVEPYSGESIRWLRFTPQGLLLIGTRSTIEAFELGGHTSPLWVNRSASITGTDEVFFMGDQIVASRPGGTLVAINVYGGAIIPGAFALPDSTRWSPSGLVAIETDFDGLTALFDERLVRFDRFGAVTGVDVIGGERTFTALVSTFRYDFVVDEQARDREDGSYKYWIHRFIRDEGCRLAGRSLELKLSDRRFECIEVIEGWMLLSTGTSVLVVPLSPDIAVEPESTNKDA